MVIASYSHSHSTKTYSGFVIFDFTLSFMIHRDRYEWPRCQVAALCGLAKLPGIISQLNGI